MTELKPIPPTTGGVQGAAAPAKVSFGDLKTEGHALLETLRQLGEGPVRDEVVAQMKAWIEKVLPGK